MKPLPRLENCLSELIALPSVSSTVAQLDTSNAAVCEALAGWLQPLGFRCEMRAVPGHPGKVNLIAVRGQGPGGLVLAGHTDTVPFDDRGWDSDPFTLTQRDGRWHGLGSCDMKGFLALCVELAADIADTPLQRPLTILATADEESGMAGAKALSRADTLGARQAVIGEPTGLRPVRMHKGIFFDAVHVHGAAGHSSDPANGINAIDGARLALNVLDDIRSQLRSGDNRNEFPVPYATLNPGCIHGGDSPNRIPAHCEIQYDLRLLPGQDIDTLRALVRAALNAAFEGTPWTLTHEIRFDGARPFETSAEADIVSAAEVLADAPARAVNFATEAGYLNALGLETIILGPGDIDQAHQPNEFLPLDSIEPMRKILRGLVHRYCVEPNP